MEKHISEKVPSVCSQRWKLAYIFSAGFFFVYGLRVNMSVAIVCMVKTPANSSSVQSLTANITSNEQCEGLDDQNFERNYEGEFDWNKDVQSTILASFFYGYIITQIPGGWLADRFGGWRVFGTAMTIAGVSTLLIPVCTRTSVILLYALRVILGLASGVVIPSSYSILGRWAPRLERTKLMVVSNVDAFFLRYKYLSHQKHGAVIGIVSTFATSGVLCEYGFDNGWGSIFYIPGGLCCVWVVIWFTQVRDSPTQHPKITQAEKDYIINNIEFDTSKRSRKIPWKDMAICLPLWAIFICHMCGAWAEYTLITSLPAFMKGVLKFDIKRNGALSSLPFICSAVTGVLLGYLGDTLRSRRILTTTQTRKSFQVIGNTSAGVFLIATGFVTCTTREVAVVFLCLAVMSSSFSNVGYAANYIDLAPQYAGILFGMSNTLATIPGMIAPIVAGLLTPNEPSAFTIGALSTVGMIARKYSLVQEEFHDTLELPVFFMNIKVSFLLVSMSDTPEEWRSVFYIGGAFYIFGGIFYAIFASGDAQTWGVDKQEDVVVEIELLPSDHEKKVDDHSLPQNR